MKTTALKRIFLSLCGIVFSTSACAQSYTLDGASPDTVLRDKRAMPGGLSDQIGFDPSQVLFSPRYSAQLDVSSDPGDDPVYVIGTKMRVETDSALSLTLGSQTIWQQAQDHARIFDMSAAHAGSADGEEYLDLQGAGVVATMIYQVTPDWAVTGSVTYDHLHGQMLHTDQQVLAPRLSIGAYITRDVAFDF